MTWEITGVSVEEDLGLGEFLVVVDRMPFFCAITCEYDFEESGEVTSAWVQVTDDFKLYVPKSLINDNEEIISSINREIIEWLEDK